MQERRHDLVMLDTPTLAAMIAPILSGHPILSTRSMVGGYSNSIYEIRFIDDTPPVVLRLHSGNIAGVEVEWAVYDRLHERVPMPEVLFIERDATRFGHPYSILSLVEGDVFINLLEWANAVAIGECAFSAGKILAEIHTIHFTQSGFLGPELAVQLPFNGDGWEGAIRGWVIDGAGRQWIGEERATRLVNLMRDHHHEVEQDPLPPTLLHADYKPQNLLMRQHGDTWSLAAVLDWEFAFAGSPLFDIGIFLREEADRPPTYASEFERGYLANGGTLPPNWRHISKLLDLLNLCQFLESSMGFPILYAEVLRRIDATLALFAA